MKYSALIPKSIIDDTNFNSYISDGTGKLPVLMALFSLTEGNECNQSGSRCRRGYFFRNP